MSWARFIERAASAAKNVVRIYYTGIYSTPEYKSWTTYTRDRMGQRAGLCPYELNDRVDGSNPGCFFCCVGLSHLSICWRHVFCYRSVSKYVQRWFRCLLNNREVSCLCIQSAAAAGGGGSGGGGGGDGGSGGGDCGCLLYTSPSPRDKRQSRMPSSA